MYITCNPYSILFVSGRVRTLGCQAFLRSESGPWLRPDFDRWRLAVEMRARREWPHPLSNHSRTNALPAVRGTLTMHGMDNQML